MTINFSPEKITITDTTIEPIILSRDTSNYDWGKEPTKRTIVELLQYGIINLDKPPNPTSHEVVSYVKKILDIPKAGHSGTLDPQVTGILPTALGSATRILNSLLLAGKEYVCLMSLHDDVEEQRIREIMGEYIGNIYQRPPLRANVKRVLRVRTIYENKIYEIEGREVLFWVSCQAGTYLRKICHDIGQSLGCGAHMKELRRIRTGPFIEDEHLASLQDLYDAYTIYLEDKNEIPLRNIILPMEYGVKHLPQIWVKDKTVDSLCHGAPLGLPGVSKYTPNFEKGDTVAIFTLKHELIALGQAQMHYSEIKKDSPGILANVKKVLMPRGTYPANKKTE